MLEFFIVFFSLALAIGVTLVAFLSKPSRSYSGAASVSSIYDMWADDPKMKFYWGNHLHAGFYGLSPERKDFVRAKFDMIDELVHWGIAQPAPALLEQLENPQPGSSPIRVLDVGCGVGGSAVYLAQRWAKSAHITGITLSSTQAHYAARLAHSQGVRNATFLVGDAMDQPFAPASFDVIWSLESEMHMPDKERFVREIARLLKPGGRVIVATWNVRDTRTVPLSAPERAHVQYLVDEWCHTSFDSIWDGVQLFEQCGFLEVTAENWAKATMPSWRDAVLVALRNGGGLDWSKPNTWWGNVRDAYTILRYDSAFRKGLCEYGVFHAQKPAGD